MRLFLIRHGETPWTVEKRYQGTTDVPLNAKGIKQAQAVARTLRREPVSKIYTSTLKRARVTAGTAGRVWGVKPVADRRLNEIHFGEWEGENYQSLSERNGPIFRRWREGKLKKPPRGESVASLARRSGEFFKEITQRHRDETVAVIAHGGPIKMLLFHALLKGRPNPASFFPSIWSLRIDSASISLVEGSPELFQIVYTNRTDHL